MLQGVGGGGQTGTPTSPLPPTLHAQTSKSTPTWMVISACDWKGTFKSQIFSCEFVFRLNTESPNGHGNEHIAERLVYLFFFLEIFLRFDKGFKWILTTSQTVLLNVLILRPSWLHTLHGA